MSFSILINIYIYLYFILFCLSYIFISICILSYHSLNVLYFSILIVVYYLCVVFNLSSVFILYFMIYTHSRIDFDIISVGLPDNVSSSSLIYISICIPNPYDFAYTINTPRLSPVFNCRT